MDADAEQGVLVHTEPDLCPHSLGLLGDGGHFSWTCFLATPALTIHERGTLGEERVDLTLFQQTLALTLLGLLLLPVPQLRPLPGVMSPWPPHHQILNPFQPPSLPSDGSGGGSSHFTEALVWCIAQKSQTWFPLNHESSGRGLGAKGPGDPLSLRKADWRLQVFAAS